MFEVEKTDDGLVAMRGRLDASQVAKAEEVLGSLTSSVRIDMNGLQYISSAGISVILKAYKRLHDRGETLKLVNLTPHVRNVFHYAGLEQVLGIE